MIDYLQLNPKDIISVRSVGWLVNIGESRVFVFYKLYCTTVDLSYFLKLLTISSSSSSSCSPGKSWPLISQVG